MQFDTITGPFNSRLKTKVSKVYKQKKNKKEKYVWQFFIAE